jgi:hypothetical protein
MDNESMETTQTEGSSFMSEYPIQVLSGTQVIKKFNE